MKYHFFFLSLFFSKLIVTQSAKFDNIVKYYNKEKQFNGVVLVASNGKIDYLKAHGVANRQYQTPVTVKSQFKIASMSKVFTAILIMKLVEAGKIDLNSHFFDVRSTVLDEPRVLTRGVCAVGVCGACVSMGVCRWVSTHR